MSSVKSLFPLHLAEITYTIALGHAILSKNKYMFRKIKLISCPISHRKILTSWIKTDLESSNKKTDVPEKTEEAV